MCFMFAYGRNALKVGHIGAQFVFGYVDFRNRCLRVQINKVGGQAQQGIYVSQGCIDVAWSFLEAVLRSISSGVL